MRTDSGMPQSNGRRRLVEPALPATACGVHTLFITPFFAWMPHGMDWMWLFIFVLLGPIIWIWALIDCVTKESSTGNTKVVWAIIIVALGFIGGIAYFLVRRPQRIRELGR